MVNKVYQQYQDLLDLLEKKQLNRDLPNISNRQDKYCQYKNKKVLNLISNDYLGIAADTQAFQNFLNQNKELAPGSTASRLLAGTHQVHRDLEETLSKIYKNPALTFNSGYHANTGIIPALITSKDIVFCDKLIHASIIDGIKLSGAKMIRFNHLDNQDLTAKLTKYRHKYQNGLIITEALFSMDGDLAKITELISLKKQHDCLLMVDEAHSFGTFGAYGIVHQQNLSEIDILIGTFGKAIGSMGAFVVANQTIIQLIKNKARSFIFSTSLPPINVGWSNHVIKNILPQKNDDRARLKQTSEKFRNILKRSNIKVIGNSQIIPIVIGNIETTLKLSKTLLAKGFLALPIRPPTVPSGSCRLRITLTSHMNIKELTPLAEIIIDNQNEV